MLDTNSVTQTVAALWGQNGGPSGPITLTPCAVSGNNRVYRVDGDGCAPIIAKVYFRPNPGDRDRLEAEWQFLSYAQRAGIGCVPSAIAFDRAANLALYSFVAGDKLTASQIRPHHIQAAARFIQDLNGPTSVPDAAQVPDAAEACFTLADHLAVVDRRMTRLTTIHPILPVDHQAVALVAEMQAYWHQLRADLLTGLAQMGRQPDQPIPQNERMLSPSDFGFHNALAGSDGALSFIDFEYAGWDDVAKLVADFFFQPAIPAPADLFESFLNQVLSDRPDAPSIAQRIRLLRPLFGVKWVCILLNLFLPDMAQRRRFADPDHDEADSKTAQLVKARGAFQTLVGTPWHT